MTTVLRHLLTAAMAALTLLTAAHGADPIPGDLDRTFANGTGFLNSTFAGPLPSGTRVAVAVQDDGKYVFATTCGAAFTDFCVFRVTAAGARDSTFVGPDPAQPGNGRVVIPIGGGNSGATAVMIQRDGRIVVAGFCELNGRRTYCVARLNRDGSLDASFDGPDTKPPGNGRVVLPSPPGLFADRFLTAALLQEDQRIVLVGYCYRTQGVELQARFCLSRLNPDGSLDDSFNGPPTLQASAGQFSLHLGDDENFATSAALRPDGGVVVAGYCKGAATLREACVAWLNVGGDLDPLVPGNVNRNGESRFRVAGLATAAHAVALQSDGKAVLVGDCIVGNWLQLCAARLRTDGGLDPSFGPSGGTLQVTIDSTNSSASSVVLQSDGKIAFAGTCATTEQSRICLMRLHSDGSGDSSFDGFTGAGNGLTQLIRNSDADRAGALALLKDGRLLTAGSCQGIDGDNVCAARIEGGPFEALQCSLDIDGDGVVTAHADLLMLMRIARGVRGAAVLNAINFTPAATRRNWQSVQRYLNSQCGLPLAP